MTQALLWRSAAGRTLPLAPRSAPRASRCFSSPRSALHARDRLICCSLYSSHGGSLEKRGEACGRSRRVAACGCRRGSMPAIPARRHPRDRSLAQACNRRAPPGIVTARWPCPTCTRVRVSDRRRRRLRRPTTASSRPAASATTSTAACACSVPTCARPSSETACSGSSSRSSADVPAGVGSEGAIATSRIATRRRLARGSAWASSAIRRARGRDLHEARLPRGCRPGALSSRARERGAPQLGTLAPATTSRRSKSSHRV